MTTNPQFTTRLFTTRTVSIKFRLAASLFSGRHAWINIIQSFPRSRTFMVGLQSPRYRVQANWDGTRQWPTVASSPFHGRRRRSSSTHYDCPVLLSSWGGRCRRWRPAATQLPPRTLAEPPACQGHWDGMGFSTVRFNAGRSDKSLWCF
jgi:hypothetical protein